MFESMRVAERLLKIAQSDPCHSWLFGEEIGAWLSERVLGHTVGSSTSSDISRAGDWDRDIVRNASRLSHVPTQEEVNAAVIVDANMSSLQADVCATYLPQGQTDRFVMGTMLTNACAIPLKPGVSAWPAYRFVGFRMRNGFGFLAVGHDSDGIPILMLSRSFYSGRIIMDQFHNLRVEGDSRVMFDIHVCIQSLDVSRQIDRVRNGNAQPNESEAFSSLAAPPRSAEQLVKTFRDFLEGSTAQALSDIDLAGALSWETWACLTIAARNYTSLVNPSIGLTIRTGLNRCLGSREGMVTSGAMFGRHYRNLGKLNAMFFDRVSTASAPRRSVPLDLYSILGLSHAFPESAASSDSRHERSLEQLMSILYPTGNLHGNAGSKFNLQDYSADDGNRTLANASMCFKSGEMVCVKCGSSFSLLAELRKHIRTVHHHGRSYPCKHCGRVFAQSSHLITHVRTVHEHRADYECESCHRKFAVRSNLNKHVKRMQGRCASRVPQPISDFPAPEVVDRQIVYRSDIGSTGKNNTTKDEATG
ncbi:Transcription factor hamlet [Porphyridium purpureum]|uniref:Transcription factor hamlet n=1 Tax=Porphyridium purpureum TaxID=35688 RepID=A0A5J4Z495_PORPP|nr:Transcription factor hamlet [Porphyridium purpureum]|eukprot:POR7886..scf295_1